MTVIIIHCFVYECYLFIYLLCLLYYVVFSDYFSACLRCLLVTVLYSKPRAFTYKQPAKQLLFVRIHNYCMLIYKIKNIIHNNQTHESLETLHTTFSQYIREYSEKSYKLSQGNGCRLLLLV